MSVSDIELSEEREKFLDKKDEEDRESAWQDYKEKERGIGTRRRRRSGSVVRVRMARGVCGRRVKKTRR